MKKILRRSEQAHSTKDKRIRVVGTCRKVTQFNMLMFVYLFNFIAMIQPYYCNFFYFYFLPRLAIGAISKIIIIGISIIIITELESQFVAGLYFVTLRAEFLVGHIQTEIRILHCLVPNIRFFEIRPGHNLVRPTGIQFASSWTWNFTPILKKIVNNQRQISAIYSTGEV